MLINFIDTLTKQDLEDPNTFEIFSSTPQERLLYAVLTRALLDIITNEISSNYPKDCKREAIRWIYSDDQYRFSFTWICDMLDLDTLPIKSFVAKSLRSQESTDPQPKLIIPRTRRIFRKEPRVYYKKGSIYG